METLQQCMALTGAQLPCSIPARRGFAIAAHRGFR